MSIVQLDAAIKTVCPIHGVSIGKWDDRATWRINFKDEATDAERKAAQKVLQSWVPVDEAPADPLEKLKAFLAENPDVAAVLK